ncbi:MAG: radical SAM protein [Candidatus Aminicenantes bacterium]|nr:radical SAM protein [Candidatus Aminicenantes bacterium]
MNHLTLIIKPTNNCNANCLYCSAWEPEKRQARMSEKTLIILFHRVEEWLTLSKRKKNIRIIWHGGEPTLMPLDFYYKAIELQEDLKKTFGIHIKNNIQTNLLYLDEKKLDMLERLLMFNGKRQTIGTSFDPLPGIRVIKKGDYTEEWEKSMTLMKERDFPFGIVYVVHKRSLQNIELLAETFLNRFPRTGIRFNPLYREGRATGSACEPLYVTPAEWGDFLVKLYRVWAAHDKKPSWQPLKEIETFHLKKKAGLSCDYAGRCGTTHLGIDTDGTVYSCGRGIDRKHKPYGNIHETSLSGILKHPARIEMMNRSVFLSQTYCHGCKWWRYCHGGCPMDAALNNGDDIFRKTNFCVSRFHFLDRVYKEPAA